MKPLDISPTTPIRPVGNETQRTGNDRNARPATSNASPAEPAMVARSGVLWSGETAPVDANRVAEIRSALREGRYPLLPATLSDHMIAAGFALIDAKED